ncbi:MAG: hypothetical protein ACJA0E_000769 [Bermanella sp.]|jgi:hypothetical protein
MNVIARWSALLTIMLFSLEGLAKVSQQQANRLGKDLTPMGAEKAGNKSGTIPAWTGGISKPLTDYKSGDFHADPYAGDKPKFQINSQNMQQHKDFLTKGQMELLSKYPSYQINVYPTHRSAAYPEFVYDAVKNNATTATLQKYGSGVLDTIMSSPFPIPATGLEVLWNHTLRYRGLRWESTAVTMDSTSNGDTNFRTREYKYYFAYSEPNITLQEIDNKIFYLKRKTIAPAKFKGGMTLIHETLDQVLSPRKSWTYNPGQRRVRRNPNLAYDTTNTDSGNIRTIDQVDMFNGAPNLYNWKIIGKAERYIPYNAYKVHQGNLKLNDIVGGYHLNPKLMRYENHRVWIIEAALRTGIQHKYAKRRYYFDEDTWQILLAEEYDVNGKLLQLSESHTINYYDIPMVYTTLDVTYDLENGRYFAEGLDNEREPISTDVTFKRKEFTSSALRREAR